MNFVHKQIAKRVVESVLEYDLNLLKEGNSRNYWFKKKILRI